MNRRDTVAALLALGVAPFGARAQQPGKMLTLGILNPAGVGVHPVFDSELHRLGWEEGRNLVIERRGASSPEELPKAAAELVRLAPNVIVVANAGMASLVRRETSTIPIVVLAAGDLVAAGLVDNLARPDGNVTGMHILQRELIGKRFQLLNRVVGKLTRAAMLADSVMADASIRRENRKQFEAIAQTLGMEPHWYEVGDAFELEDLFRTMSRQRVQGLNVMGSGFTMDKLRFLTELAARYRIPATYELRAFVVGGGLMSYGVYIEDMYTRGAGHVNKILRGARPSDLPVEQPTRFQLVINVQAAKALGITIPQSVLLGADELIDGHPLPVPGKTAAATRWRIGVLSENLRTVTDECRASSLFAEDLKKHGLIEGQHFAIEHRCADGQPERLPEIARQLVASKVDVIVTEVFESALAARAATDRIPIVMMFGPDPVAQGWARSYSRPGGNLTGFTWEIDEEASIGLKGYELIKEVIPNVRRIVHLERAGHSFVRPYDEARKKAAARLGVEISLVGIPDAKGVVEAFRKIREMKADALSISPDGFVSAHAMLIMNEVAKARLPVQAWGGEYGLRQLPRALFGFGPRVDDQPRRAAGYVARILRGEKPGDLPIERPVRTELVFDLKAARWLGLTIPRSVLMRADKVIE